MAAQLPAKLTIGAHKAFQNGYAFPYQLEHISSQTIYVCNKGSEWARSTEVLILRRDHGSWIAYDGERGADGSSWLCRQAVFRCREDITSPGWHTWQTNYTADVNESTGSIADWRGELTAETRLQ